MFLFKKKEAPDSYKKYGAIKTNLRHYVTPTMVIVVVMCTALTILNFDQVYINFETNIPLNSLILAVFGMAMIEAFNANMDVYRVAFFLRGIDDLIEKPIVEEDDVHPLKKALESGAFLVNTQNTFNLLVNLQKYGHPMVTDNDARLIKSKLGFRIRNQRAKVSFMAGLLVMLGLIGTFWGLLLTIADVSKAMDVIAEQANNLGVDTGDGEGGGIGGIIESISAPLQGMGLAFSSSLFGLAGSLVVGFFNYACSQAQDKAIEDFSRWIDEKIPGANAEEELLKIEQAAMSKGGQAEAVSEARPEVIVAEPVMEADGGFNKDFMSQLMYALKNMMNTNAELADNFDNVTTSLRSIQEILEGQGSILTSIDQNNLALKQHAEISSAITEKTYGVIYTLEEGYKQSLALQQQSLEQVTHGHDLVNEASSKITRILGGAAKRNLDMQEKIVAQVEAGNTLLEQSSADFGAEAKQVNEEFKALRGVQNAALQMAKNNHADMAVYFKNAQQALGNLSKEVGSLKQLASQGNQDVIVRSTSEINKNLQKIEASLQANNKVLRNVAQSGGTFKTAKMLSDVQMFWNKMQGSDKSDDSER